MSKKKTLFSRETHEMFPLASEKGAIEWRQAFLEGLLENKNAMGEMTEKQLRDLFPASTKNTEHTHGYRRRSMMSSKDAGSALAKAFKKKK